ncbi:MAG: ATP-binding protein [Alphaproteobacteria bacterium]|nr:ATP-binding protein [Alphaproteobacteria bacterium]
MARAPLTVLVVASHTGQAERFQALLERQDPTRIRLRSCSRASQVLVETTEKQVDAMVVALASADKTGVMDIERVCVLVPETAVIVLTEVEDEDLDRQLVQAGAQDVIAAAALDSPDLVARIRNAVDRQRQMVEQATRRHHLEVANQRFRSLISDRFRSLVMDNADAMLVLDKGGNTCFINPAAETLLRDQSGDLIGSRFANLSDIDEETEIEVPRADGSVLVAAMRIMDTVWEGEDAYIVTLHDITERKRLERAMRAAKQTAERASKMKSLFLANMSHELRTPLNAIIGFAELMEAQAFGPLGHKKYLEYARHITQSGGHLLELINGLLDLSKAEAGKLELRREEFDLGTVIRGTVEVMEARARRGKVRLRTELQDEPFRVMADRLKIRQIMLNLLSNAVKFTPEGGEVRVSVACGRDNQIEIQVIDTGIGMPRDQIPKAFAAFNQVENAWTKKLAEGSGLGLALTKRLVELHGGTIKLTSEVGVGTTATVLLPCKPQSGAKSENETLPVTA